MDQLITAIQNAIQAHFNADRRSVDASTIEQLVRDIESPSNPSWNNYYSNFSSNATPISTDRRFFGFNERHQFPFGQALLGMMALALDQNVPPPHSDFPTPEYLVDLSCIAAEHGVVHFCVPFTLIGLMEGFSSDRSNKIMRYTMNEHKWTVPLFAAITGADAARSMLASMERSPGKQAPTIDWEIVALCTLTKQDGEHMVHQLRQSGYCVVDRFLRDRQSIGRLTAEHHSESTKEHDEIIRSIAEHDLEAIEARAKEATATLGEFSQQEQVRRFRFGGGSKATIGLSGIVQALKIQLCCRLGMALLRLSHENPDEKQERMPFDDLPSNLLVPESVVVTSFLEDEAPPSSVVSWPDPIAPDRSSIVAAYFLGGPEQERPDTGGIHLWNDHKTTDVKISALRDRLLLFLPNKLSFESLRGNVERFELVSVFSDANAQPGKDLHLDPRPLMTLSESDIFEIVDEQLRDPQCRVCEKMAKTMCPICRRVFYCGEECAAKDLPDHRSHCVPFERQPHFRNHLEAQTRLEQKFREQC